MSGYLTEFMARLVDIEKNALLPTLSDSVPYWLYQQSSFPYFTNRYGGFTRSSDIQDMLQLRHTVTARLIIGHVSGNYNGMNEGQLHEWIPIISLAFMDNNRWQPTGVTPPVISVIPAYTVIQSNSGVTAFQMPEGFPPQVGCEWVINFTTNQRLTNA